MLRKNSLAIYLWRYKSKINTYDNRSCYLDFGFAGDEAKSLYCFGVMNCIQYANRTRQNFSVVENSSGSCCLKMQQMAGVADFLREFINTIALIDSSINLSQSTTLHHPHSFLEIKSIQLQFLFCCCCCCCFLLLLWSIRICSVCKWGAGFQI